MNAHAKPPCENHCSIEEIVRTNRCDLANDLRTMSLEDEEVQKSTSTMGRFVEEKKPDTMNPRAKVLCGLRTVEALSVMCQWCDEELNDPRAGNYAGHLHELIQKEVTGLIEQAKSL